MMSLNNGNNKSSWAYIGLVLGILSIFFAFIGIVPLSGVVVNIAAIHKSRSLNGKGKWMAVIGLGLSILFTVVYLRKYGYVEMD